MTEKPDSKADTPEGSPKGTPATAPARSASASSAGRNSSDEPGLKPLDAPGAKAIVAPAPKTPTVPNPISSDEPGLKPLDAPGAKAIVASAPKPPTVPSPISSDEPGLMPLDAPGAKTPVALAPKAPAAPVSKSPDEPGLKSLDAPPPKVVEKAVPASLSETQVPGSKSPTVVSSFPMASSTASVQDVEQRAAGAQPPEGGPGGATESAAAQAAHLAAAAAAASSQAVRDTTPLGKFELYRRLGTGGMGAVYLAVDTKLNRVLALKLLPRDKAANPTLVRRFEAEAQSSAQLRHENIVSVYEAGHVEGYLYIALEYVDGTDVHKLLTEKHRLPVEQTIDIVRQTAKALQHAYEMGIVHRDIKPSNLLVSHTGTVKLTDMGLARSVDEATETGITRAGTTVGTVDYMAPEQARDSKAADIRSDIYSLGCTWYQMLTGSPPFPEGSLTNKLYAHVTKPRPDPRTVDPTVPQRVVDVLHKMMSKSPKTRYQTPSELLDDLDRLDEAAESDDAHELSDAMEGMDLGAAGSGGEKADDFGRDEEEPVEGRGAKGGRARTAAPAPPKSRKPGTAAAKSAPAKSKKGKATSAGRRPWKKILAGVGGVAVVGLLVWGAIVFFTRPAEPTGPGPNTVDTPGPGPAPVDPGPTPTPPDKVDPPPVVPNPPIAVRPTPSRLPPIPTAPDPLDPRAVSPRIRSGREADRGYVPAWVADVLAPEEAVQPPEALQLPVVTVGRTSGPPAQHATIAEALAALPATGGVVRLTGDGPFLLEPVVLEGRGHVVLAADPASRPLIVLVSETPKAAASWIDCRKTDLTLVGVHLFVDAADVAGRTAPSLVSVTQGRLVSRLVSCTLRGSVEGGMAAFRIAHTGTAQVLLDRTLVRGGTLTAVDLDAAGLDLCASGSLFVAGDAPVVTLKAVYAAPAPATTTAPATATTTPAAPTAPTTGGPRLARFLSSTLFSRRRGIECTFPESGGEPVPTVFDFRNSIVATRSSVGRQTLLWAEGWPVDVENGTGEQRPRHLGFSTGGSLYLGWGELLRAGAISELTIEGTSSWQRLWRRSLASDAFVPQSWPEAAAVAEASTLAPSVFDASAVSRGRIAGSDGRPPGCDPATLTVPRAETILRADRLAERTRTIEPLVDPQKPAKRVLVDLTAVDLGRFLTTENLPSGSLVVAHGKGSVMSSPVRVQGKTLRIEFKQTGPDPLIVQARPLNVKDIDVAAGHFDAFFSVKDGGLELVDGNFRLSSAPTSPLPSWFLQVADGNFLLRNCEVRTTGKEAGSFKGLVRWMRFGRPAKGTDGFEQRGAVVDSFLAGPRMVLEGDVRNRLLVLRNTVAVGTERLFDLSAVGYDQHRDAIVDIERCTLSARKTFFSVRTDALRGAASRTVRFYVHETVFAPPVGKDPADATGPVILEHDPSALTQKQVDWWGFGNAYAQEIGSFLKRTADPSAVQDFEQDWVRAWKGQTVRPLRETDAVLLREPLPPFPELTRARFALAPTCGAAGWAVDGRPVGASPVRPELPVIDLEAEEAPTSPPGTAAPPSRFPSVLSER